MPHLNLRMRIRVARGPSKSLTPHDIRIPVPFLQFVTFPTVCLILRVCPWALDGLRRPRSPSSEVRSRAPPVVLSTRGAERGGGEITYDYENLEPGGSSVSGFVRLCPGGFSDTPRAMDGDHRPQPGSAWQLDRPSPAGPAQLRPRLLDDAERERPDRSGRKVVGREGGRGLARYLDGSRRPGAVLCRDVARRHRRLARQDFRTDAGMDGGEAGRRFVAKRQRSGKLVAQGLTAAACQSVKSRRAQARHPAESRAHRSFPGSPLPPQEIT